MPTEILPHSGPSLIETTDAVASTSTAYALAIGSTGQGVIGAGGDHDWWRVNLVAGQTYAFAVIGTGTAGSGASPTTDPYLRLIGLDGVTVLGSNDDGLQNHNSILTFTATTSGSYYLDVSGFSASNTGQYGVVATQGTRLDLDLSMMAGAIDTHAYWTATRGTGTAVTFAFRASYSGSLTNFTQMNAAEQSAVLQIFALISELTGLTFQQVNPGGTSDNAAILLANYSASDGTGGHASYPGSTAATDAAGDVWMNVSPPTSAVLPSSWLYMALMHEIGHAIGLSHPGQYNAGSGVAISYDNSAQFIQDTLQYSVMSYWSETNTGANYGATGDPQTYMLMDIATLQAIYGANTATRAGDTTYGFHSNAGNALYDFAINRAPALTIWDGGGTNTLDLSLTPANQTIRLTAGSISSVVGGTDNLSIALGVTFKAAIGGFGNDRITGNDAGDTLTGGVGADTITGGTGSDTILGDGSTVGAATDTYGLNFTSGQTLRGTALTGLPTSAMTLEFMIKFQPGVGTEWFFTMPGLQVMIDPTNSTAPGMWFYLNSTWAYSQITVAQLSDGAAHRISFTWDSASGSAAFYLDGSQVKTTSAYATGVTLAGSGQVTFNPVNASLGDVRLYTTALSADAIALSAAGPLANPVGTAGLVLDWSVAADGTVSNALGSTAPVKTGSPTASLLHSGSAYDDTLNGGAGDDTITGGMGNDTIDGGAGTDTAVFSGSRANYTLRASGGALVVTDQTTGRDGSDTISNVENFNFGGTVLSLAALQATLLATPVITAVGPTQIGYNDPNAPYMLDALANVTGTGIAGDTITLYNGEALVGTTTVNADGSWSVAAMLYVQNSTSVSFTAVQSDQLGNGSLSSSATAYSLPAFYLVTSTTWPVSSSSAPITIFDTGSELAPSSAAAGGSWAAALTLMPADGSGSVPSLGGAQTIAGWQIGKQHIDTSAGGMDIAANYNGKTEAQTTHGSLTTELFFASDGHVLSEVWSQNGVVNRVENFNADGSVAQNQTGLHDTLDLFAFDPASATLAYSENADHTAGTLTLTEGNLRIAFALTGHHALADFLMSADGHGGLLLSTVGHDPIFPGL